MGGNAATDHNTRDSDGTCESCGGEDEPLQTVRRVYLTPESWDTEASTRVADDTEAWCDVCLTHYPHQAV